ncbi:Multifunctional CCA protein [bioreactor metagenome]
MVAREHGTLGQFVILRPETIVKILERCDAQRRPERFVLMLQAAACDYLGRGGNRPPQWPPADGWRLALNAFRQIDAGAIARACNDKSRIPERIHAERVAAVRRLREPAHTPERDAQP